MSGTVQIAVVASANRRLGLTNNNLSVQDFGPQQKTRVVLTCLLLSMKSIETLYLF